MDNKNGLLMAANWNSGVGYAWWLMESYWKVLADHHSGHSIVAYPKITTIPTGIQASKAKPVEANFTLSANVIDQCRFIRAHHIKTIYLTDQPVRSWRYAVWRMAGARRIVTHDHTPGLRTRPAGLKRAVKALLNRLPFVTVDMAIGATEFVRDRLVNVACMPAHKCHAAPNGIPQMDVEPIDVRAEFGIPGDRLILVSTGRAAPIKNIEFALRLVAQADEVHFLHIGDGPDLDRLRGVAADLGIEDRVTWAGKRSDVPALLAGCDIAIQPSNGEVGYSLSILEYMRAGLPVMVPENPSVCGATEHGMTGVIYSGEQDAIDYLRGLAANSEVRKRMGRQAVAIVRDKFALDTAKSAVVSAVLAYSP